MPSGWVERRGRDGTALPRNAKMSIAMAADAAAVPILLLLAVTLRRASLTEAMQLPIYLYATACVVAVTSFWAIGMYRAVFRFITHGRAAHCIPGCRARRIAARGVQFHVLGSPITFNALTIFGVLLLLYLFVSRSLLREFLTYRHRSGQRVVIYGAGSAGVQLLRSLREAGQYVPVAFVDADPALQGKLVADLKVYSPEALTSLVKKKSVTSVLLAIPSLSHGGRQRILHTLESLPVAVRTVPDAQRHRSRPRHGQRVARSRSWRPARPRTRRAERCAHAHVHRRQGRHGDRRRRLDRLGAVPPDRAARRRRGWCCSKCRSAALYQIERELQLQVQRGAGSVEIVALLGKARHRHRVREIMHDATSVQTVYHAAAYKHVPIVEQNIIEGIHNNVFGTWHTARGGARVPASRPSC